MIESQLNEFKQALQAHAADYDLALPGDAIERISKYFSLLTRWNGRLHLVAFDSAQEFATRHVLESLTLLKYLPAAGRIVDVGSGGGLPSVPCLLARTDLQAVLIEASRKKATFLSEVARQTDIKPRVSVIAERFENIKAPEADVVTCRALEQFASMLPRLLDWAPPKAALFLFGGRNLGNAIHELGISPEQMLLPNSDRRYLFVIKPSQAKA